ncbi:hypothetical protein CYMTET_3256 [Cymbomonas tetramitiformis]|uniref:Uncharacterized protein n=1 Tax=Cymbomonas tetramitiformis TaxID=36881 RepID=A0AAE0LLQ5_9CHLO|nr:hypothetical protein CYMTET_3256 [Cymbomonas tetramitiformis]|eukprot:gene10076-11927_t
MASLITVDLDSTHLKIFHEGLVEDADEVAETYRKHALREELRGIVKALEVDHTDRGRDTDIANDTSDVLLRWIRREGMTRTDQREIALFVAELRWRTFTKFQNKVPEYILTIDESGDLFVVDELTRVYASYVRVKLLCRNLRLVKVESYVAYRERCYERMAVHLARCEGIQRFHATVISQITARDVVVNGV